MISQPWHPLCSLASYSKGVFMPNRDIGRKSQNLRDTDEDDRVRGRADEMEDAPEGREEFEDIEDLNDEEEEEGEGSF
jgi:hypothetical protein